ncbi:MAG: hypothetical protein ABEJ56_02510 [Candidatus Nanohaloarchaea archaeon]
MNLSRRELLGSIGSLAGILSAGSVLGLSKFNYEPELVENEGRYTGVPEHRLDVDERDELEQLSRELYGKSRIDEFEADEFNVFLDIITVGKADVPDEMLEDMEQHIEAISVDSQFVYLTGETGAWHSPLGVPEEFRDPTINTVAQEREENPSFGDFEEQYGNNVRKILGANTDSEVTSRESFYYELDSIIRDAAIQVIVLPDRFDALSTNYDGQSERDRCVLLAENMRELDEEVVRTPSDYLMMHEVYHALGLDRLETKENIMYQQSARGTEMEEWQEYRVLEQLNQ